jgi:hypothetical protein
MEKGSVWLREVQWADRARGFRFPWVGGDTVEHSASQGYGIAAFFPAHAWASASPDALNEMH